MIAATRRQRWVVGAILAPFALIAASPASADDAAMSRALDAALASALEENRIVGAVVLVARQGEVIYERAVGMADREGGAEMKTDTIFRLASLSKPIVTAAAMRLVEEGVLGLDDPVTRYLPDFTPRHDGTTPRITLRQLLSHTSGVGYRGYEVGGGPYTDAGVQDGAFGTGITLEENVRRIASAPLKFEPGTSWSYGLGIDVVGRVIEVAPHLPLEVAVRDLVTEPLGMADTGFSVPVWDTPRLAVNYRDGNDGPVAMADAEWLQIPGTEAAALFEPPRATDVDAWPSAGAGMSGTAGDMLALLGTLEPGGGFLSGGTVETMLTPVAESEAEANGPGWGFGIGGAVLLDPVPTQTSQPIGTFAWSGAYGHTWFVDPATGTTVIALTNTAWEGLSGRFATDIRDAIYAR